MNGYEFNDGEIMTLEDIDFQEAYSNVYASDPTLAELSGLVSGRVVSL